MRQLSHIGLCLLVLLTGACQEPAKQPAPGKALYFDVPAYIGSQVQLLVQQDPQARKSVVENGRRQESKTLQRLQWQKELAAFAEIDLNKPAFRNAFTITRQPGAGGLVTETYRRKAGWDANIEFLSVTRGPDQQVRQLRASRKNENPLIATSQNLELTSHLVNGRYRIQSFRIGGQQQPLIFDPLQYLIITEIH